MTVTEWLDSLMDAIAGCWEWHALGLRIGIRFHEPHDSHDSWEVWAFPAVQEIVGGQDDGKRSWAVFNFDVSHFLERFEARHLSVHAATPDYPSELVLGGRFGGAEALLHICLEPPPDAEPTELVDITGADGARIRDKD